ncbi:AidA/PixA family protein [Flavobacterium pectinovorum]|uniref:AidA/PixA family protein n=1 Tax=Flavobacterium pectinovorum TaxID=29533 RepID=UPI001FADE209|nr:AidA/PixA family protein [Flavobacterium pectinovorum]MCI9843767.1 hypothetical protein [Flavobacterium pectinovorum]
MATSTPVIQKKSCQILIVVDTAAIKSKNYDIDGEKPIKIKKAEWFLIYQKTNIHTVTDSLHSVSIDSKKNNNIMIFGISIDGGSSDAIILNQIKNYNSKKNILSFEPICVSENVVSNTVNDEGELFLTNVEQNFIWFESVIFHPGKIKVKIYFSLYYLSSDGNQQDLYGHFWFPLEIKLY